MADASATPLHVKQDNEEEELDQENSKTQKRICDFCGEAKALLYCRADSAKLCFSCDQQVHSTNQLFTKHTRSLLCDSCDSTPASILCSTENLVLCQNCDWEIHSKSLSSIHQRRPLEGFHGCPSVNELLSVLGFEDSSKKDLFCDDDLVDGCGGFGKEGLGDDGFSDLLVWETPCIVSIDDLIVSNSSQHCFQAMGVPPLPKNRKAACGKYKEEILRQLRKMAKSESNFDDYGRGDDIEPLMQFQSLVPEQDLQPGNMYAGFEHGTDLSTVPHYEARAFWCGNNVELANQGLRPSKLQASYIEESCLVPEKDSDIGGSASHANCGPEVESQHHGTEALHVLPKVTIRELTSQERDFAISRYKEKKKTRRYDKHVRYESRRIRAEKRTRIKGRFAKIEH
ncbi:hypothetical protein ACSBR2_021222 [Camellia fascicularis]